MATTFADVTREKKPAVAVVALGLAAGLLIAAAPLNSQWLLVFGTGLVLLLALVIARAQKRSTLLDPVYISAAVFGLLFIIRPAHDVLTGNRLWVNVDISHVYLTVLTAAFIAAVGYFSAVLSSAPRFVARIFRAPADNLVTSRLLVCAYVFLIMSFSLKILAALTSGGIGMLTTRRESFSASGANIPILAEGSMIILPALLIFMYTRHNSRLPSIFGLLWCAIFILGSLYVGDRRYAIVLLTSAAAFHVMGGGYRPSLLRLGIGALLLYVFVIAPVELTRSGTEDYSTAVQSSMVHPVAVADTLLLQSQSTSMLNAFGVLVDTLKGDSGIGYRYGLSTFTESVLQPIPRQLWKSKPEPIRTIVIAKRWGFADGRCLSLCPTFSALGPFYSDFGLLGVFIGSLVCGVLVCIPFQYFQVYPSTFLARSLASSVVLSPLFLWWGSVGSLVLSAGISIIPLVLAVRFGQEQ